MMHLECFMSLGACAQNLSDYPEVIIHVDLCCFWFRLSKGNLNLFFLASLPFVKKIIKKKIQYISYFWKFHVVFF